MADWKVLEGDCLDVMRGMEDNSVDSIVTDPPYGLSFMGKKWDYDVPSVEIWAECLRVLKPGGHLLAFAGTRTQHRMAVRIEDAGFEIRDMIAWVYGSGFPKSLDVSKAIDKNNGEVGRLWKFTAYMRTTGLTAKQLNEATGTFMGSHYLTDKAQPAIPTPELWQVIRPLSGDVPGWVDELVARIAAEREVVGRSENGIAGGTGKHAGQSDAYGFDAEFDITTPATPAAQQWEGWGTALKPALEPITVARKPLEGTVAENVLRHGTGAINVDGCRVGANDGENRARPPRTPNTILGGGKGTNLTSSEHNDAGRWPANLIHDGSDEVVGLLGEAARFFYCAKASKADRDDGCKGLEERVAAVGNVDESSGRDSTKPGNQYGKGSRNRVEFGLPPTIPRRNHHPTVKPTDLMRYLCRLVTPPGGLVLDPFTGSGSTGRGAVLEGFSFIGIEMDPEFVAIAKARIHAAPGDQLSLF
jgi:DNA modification methylase